jgi:ribosomal protein S8E
MDQQFHGLPRFGFPIRAVSCGSDAVEHDHHRARRDVTADSAVVGRTSHQVGDQALEFSSSVDSGIGIHESSKGSRERSVRQNVGRKTSQEVREVLSGRQRRITRLLAQRCDLPEINRRGQSLTRRKVSVESAHAYTRASGEVIKAHVFITIEHRASRQQYCLSVSTRVGPQSP